MSKTREYHDDGSYTDRYDGWRHTSVTHNEDGSIRETSRDKSSLPLGDLLDLDPDIRVTKDGDGTTINVQKLKK